MSDVDILRNLLTIEAPVELLLEEVAAVSGISTDEIHSALCRVCNDWVEIAPQHSVEARKPVNHVIGKLVDLWVAYRDANLSDQEKRSIEANESTREGFVKNDPTARALFSAISRLCSPALLAAGARAQQKVDRFGWVSRIGQDPFKVFFNTLFIFDPERADVTKSTSEQFILYLWSRLEAQWWESRKRSCEDGAIRSVLGRGGEVVDMASMVEDKSSHWSTTSVDHRDQFEWTRAALESAVEEGVIRVCDYEAIIDYFGLGVVEPERGERRRSPSVLKSRAHRGIELFKRYLSAREEML